MYDMKEQAWDMKFLMAIYCTTLIFCLILAAFVLFTNARDTDNTTDDGNYSTRIIETDGADWACLVLDGQTILDCERTGEQ